LEIVPEICQGNSVIVKMGRSPGNNIGINISWNANFPGKNKYLLQNYDPVAILHLQVHTESLKQNMTIKRLCCTRLQMKLWHGQETK
jgi:hypothetical protein